MPYRSLGRCGTKVGALSLGGWTTFGGSVQDNAAIRAILLAAFEGGINFFDIADVYAQGEAERVMGKVLAELPRRHLVISSKCYFPFSDEVNDQGLSRKHIMESVHDSLRRIGTDYLDIYFCHRPDENTPLEETVRAMDDLVHQGKIIYWGTSSWTADRLRDAHALCDAKGYYHPQVEQPYYNLLGRKIFDRELLPVVQERGTGVVAFSPLASGFLSGKYDEGFPKGARLTDIEWLRKGLTTEQNIQKVKKMKALADDLGCTRAQLALAWVLARPGITSAITGATSLEQLQQNLGALDITLDDGTLKALNALFPE